jgi:hypothetical protein
MATLTSGITASQRKITVTTPGSPIVGGYYRIDDELIRLLGYWKGIVEGTVAEDDSEVVAWAADTTCWYVERGTDTTPAVAHDAGDTVEAWVVTTSAGGEGGGGVTITVADEDPGAVGAGNLWLQTDDEEGNHDTLMLWLRNDADDGWLQATAGAFYTEGAGVQQVALYDLDTGRMVGGVEASSGSVVLQTWAPPSDANARRQVLLSTDGLQLQLGPSVVTVLTGTVDPSADTGVAATVPAMYIRENGSATELWLKSGAGATAWTQLIGV